MDSSFDLQRFTISIDGGEEFIDHVIKILVQHTGHFNAFYDEHLKVLHIQEWGTV